jgi:hypothetical protein
MQDSEYQSRALDQYFDALLRDPDTNPPHELDAETVALVRALVEGTTKAEERVKDRVWSRVLFATYAPPELEPTYSPPTIIPLPRKQRTDVAFLVAAVFAVVFLSGLFIRYTDTAKDSLPVYTLEERLAPVRSLPIERFMPGMQQDWRRKPALQEAVVLSRYSLVRMPE